MKLMQAATLVASLLLAAVIVTTPGVTFSGRLSLGAGLVFVAAGVLTLFRENARR